MTETSQGPRPQSEGAPAPLASLRDVVATYRTCELATIGRHGAPVAWPTVCRVSPDARRISITTSIALPVKALNIRRDPRVALLFSDPTGTGRTDLPQVLVQGTATCSEDVHTGPDGLEEYWQQLWRRQPSSAQYLDPGPQRRLMAFYYLRLVIDVVPETVTVRPPLRRRDPIAAARPDRRDHSPYAEAARRLAGYHDAVLASVDGSGPITLRRVDVVTDPVRRRLLLSDPSGDDVPSTAGAASLLLHRHDDLIDDLHQLVLLGRVDGDDGGTAFTPTRFVPGPDGSNPLTMLRTVWTLNRTASRYLRRRQLARPVVDWDAYARLR